VVDIERVRELAELMDEHGLNEVRIREGETTIDLRKGSAVAPGYMAAPVATPTPAAAVPAAEADADEGLVPIRCPMVGTFYTASDPESPPFVSIGSEVMPDSPVCIIEAMKVFNEIKAEVAGTIERMLVQNEQAVEFGQPLMLVRPKS